MFLRTSAGGVLIASRRGTTRPLATAVPATSRAVVWAIERFGAPIPVWQCVLRRPIGYWRRTARGLRSGGVVMLALTLLLPAGVMESTAFLPRLLLLLAAPWPVILRRLLPALLVRTVPMVLRAGVVVDVSGGGVLLGATSLRPHRRKTRAFLPRRCRLVVLLATSAPVPPLGLGESLTDQNGLLVQRKTFDVLFRCCWLVIPLLFRLKVWWLSLLAVLISRPVRSSLIA